MWFYKSNHINDCGYYIQYFSILSTSFYISLIQISPEYVAIRLIQLNKTAYYTVVKAVDKDARASMSFILLR